MSLVYIGFGSNLGNCQENIEKAISELEKRELGHVLRRSKLYLSKPIKCDTPQNDYYNCAIELMTDIEAHILLKKVKEVEVDFGRKDEIHNSPRVIDIDLLLYDCVILNDDVVLPHPRLHERLFVLYPLLDIKKKLYHPILKKSIEEIVSELSKEILSQKIEEVK